MMRPEASLAIQVLPKFTDDASDRETIRVVDAVIAHLKNQGRPVQVGPFETTIEGQLSELLPLLQDCLDICIREGAQSVASYIKIFYGPHKGVLGIEEKTAKHRAL